MPEGRLARTRANQPEVAGAQKKACGCPSCGSQLTAYDMATETWVAPRAGCPKCGGPSINGGVCLGCLRPLEPDAETPWGV